MLRARRDSFAESVVVAASAGVVAGAGAGAIDGVWSWSDIVQFLPDFAARLRFVLHLAAAYALAGAIVGVAAAAVLGYLTHLTRLGDLARHAAARHRETRRRDPRDALAGLSLVVAGVPCVAAALGLTYLYGGQALVARKHLGLIIASAMGLAVAGLLAGVVASFVLARPLELGLRALSRREPVARVLSAWQTALAAVGVLLATAVAVVVVASWETLSLLPLRPLWVVVGAAVLAVPSVATGRRLVGRLSDARPWARRALPALVPIALFAVVLASGSTEGVRKAAAGYSGLAGAIGHGIRRVLDFDRDGFSPLLGGDDCDDWDRSIHPGAAEIPDDGIDQNCVGGDVTLSRSPADVGFTAVPGSVPPGFNVVLVTIDTVRADHFGAYGYHRPTTPNIDRVARTGALFVNAWAHAPSTRYSVPAILTGRYPLSVWYDTSIRGWPGLAENNTTVAELMKQAGMTTGAILNYWYFDTSRRMDQGFDHYDDVNKRLHRQVPGKGPAQTTGSSSREQTDKAIAFVADHADERFFLWVHYYDPHFEYQPHAEVPSFGTDPIDRYDQEIRFTDLHVGRLLDDLHRRGLAERTVVAITGDHGEGFGEHGVELHGYHLYAAQTKVPLIIRVPGLAPVEVTTPVGHVDLLPTLTNLLGLPASTEMMGRSLLDLMSGGADPRADRWVFQQLSYENDNEMRAAASQRCHVIYNVSPSSSWELYRLDIDPLESRDVIDSPGPCADARGVLEAWYDRSEIPEGAADALLAEPPSIAEPLDLDLGDAVRLLAVDLPTGPVAAGQDFTITLTFEARGTVDDGWRVFAHFEGPRGHRFLADHPPPRPFSWWRDGQYIRYTHTATVPRGSPAGAYTLWLGLFRKAERQPARSPRVTVRDDRADVGTVHVAPAAGR